MKVGAKKKKKDEMLSSHVFVCITPFHRELLDYLAKKNGRTVTSLARMYLIEGIVRDYKPEEDDCGNVTQKPQSKAKAKAKK
jgi:hypothetical protein